MFSCTGTAVLKNFTTDETFAIRSEGIHWFEEPILASKVGAERAWVGVPAIERFSHLEWTVFIYAGNIMSTEHSVGNYTVVTDFKISILRQSSSKPIGSGEMTNSSVPIGAHFDPETQKR